MNKRELHSSQWCYENLVEFKVMKIGVRALYQKVSFPFPPHFSEHSTWTAGSLSCSSIVGMDVYRDLNSREDIECTKRGPRLSSSW